MTITQPQTTTGLILARYGQQVDIETPQGHVQRLYLKRSMSHVVTGDHVLLDNSKDPFTLLSCLPRTSVLAKIGSNNKIKTMAANVNQLLLIIAPQPAPTLALIDDYLIMAHALQISPILVFNKQDLLTPTQRHTWNEQLKIYHTLNYPIIFTSSETQQGLVRLTEMLHKKTSILVGQSGVGKSSIVQQLIPDTLIRVSALSHHSQHGKHTTTTTRLYHLSCGGDLIDSPGVRSFSLGSLPTEKMAACFVEFTDYLGQCRFHNCQHVNEPKCAIIEALHQGKIASSRYMSYQRLIKKEP